MRTRPLAAGFACALLVLLSGCGSSAHTSTGEHDHSKRAGNSPVTAGAREIVVKGDANSFSPNTIEVTEGEDIAIKLSSTDVDHDLNIEGVTAHVIAVKGQTAVGGFTAPKAGEYKIFCSEPGHKEAGMVGTLKVKAKAGGATPGSTAAPASTTTMHGM